MVSRNCPVFVCLLILSVAHTNAFFISRSHVSLLPVVQQPTKIFVSQPVLDEEAERVFGTPLDDKTKERNKNVVNGIKSALFDTFFAEESMKRSFARFWTLETIARMPYFSYLSVLHLYETLGWWRRSDYLKVHFLQTWNEQHHLLIMEELEGDSIWFDRFLAQHIAVSYFFMGLAFYICNPTFAYNFNQAVEEEAYETYNSFLNQYSEKLQNMPAPIAAKKYYLEDHMFEAMGSRPRPKMESLFDAIKAIRDDEAEHAETMISMQEEGL